MASFLYYIIEPVKHFKNHTMKKDIKKTIEVLNDLIKINNDRIAGYEKAKTEIAASEGDLITLFTEMIAQSRNFLGQLRSEVLTNDGELSSGTTFMGKLYRSWMDVKATFSGNDRQSILNACEFGEDAAQKAYEMANDEREVTEQAISLILLQRRELRNSHNKIKQYKDEKTISSL